MDLAEFQPYARTLSRWYPTSGGGKDEQDVYQEAMVGAWRALQKYDGRGEEIGYVKLQMKRRVIDFIRHRSKGKTIMRPDLLPLEEWAAIGGDATLECVLERERLRTVIDAVQGLPKRERARMAGRLNGLSNEEIAAREGLAEGSIDMSFWRARKMLKLALAA